MDPALYTNSHNDFCLSSVPSGRKWDFWSARTSPPEESTSTEFLTVNCTSQAKHWEDKTSTFSVFLSSILWKVFLQLSQWFVFFLQWLMSRYPMKNRTMSIGLAELGGLRGERGFLFLYFDTEASMKKSFPPTCAVNNQSSSLSEWVWPSHW